MNIKQDTQLMAQAIVLAKKGWFSTDPNPRVGCIIVKQDNIIGQGWHQYAGKAHAEIMALANAGDVRGATVYVTLEPCSHQGRTPACTEALIKAGISRVVVAMQDPNPQVAGSGLKILVAAGIDVVVGVLKEEAKLLNLGFISRMNRGRPYVISKIACSLDGRTATASGASKWITSKQARSNVQQLRAGSSAILTGIGTVLADDPSLNARLNTRIKNQTILQPMRIVLDSKLQMPITAKMLNLPGRTLILTGAKNSKRQQALRHAGAEVIELTLDDNGHIELNNMLLFLGKQAINQVLVEAGSVLNGALMAQQLIDEWIVFMASIVIGDAGRGLFRLPLVRTMRDKITLQLVETRAVGKDLRLRYLLAKNQT